MKYIVEDKDRSSLFLFIATQKRPNRCVRMHLKYACESERAKAIKELEEFRNELAELEGYFSLSATRSQLLNDTTKVFRVRLSPELSARSLKVSLSAIPVVENGLSSLDLTSGQRRALKATGLLSNANLPSSSMISLYNSFNDAISVLRGSPYTSQEAVQILETLFGEVSGLKAMKIRPLSVIVLALIDRGLLSTGLIADALFGERNNHAWATCTQCVQRLEKAGLVCISYYDNTSTNEVTEKGHELLDTLLMKLSSGA